ncbi:V-set and transmembrane domain-containing protein 4 [Crotalus adamanteus]|uniref:V-set and transmembrane domain-containing protein 4 n=1 Tax=Crotalus adamanteus TaxID=8729 RepID=A0AAW1BIF6_CROAD
MTKYGVVQYYGNYTSHFYKRRLRLMEEKHRTMYTFLILNIQQAEQGHYICKVQEIGKQRNKWTSWSNGSASTEVQVLPSHFLDEEKHKTWAFFEDLSVYAVLMCSAGILSILLFGLVLLCRILSHRKRSHVKRYLVKCPQKSLEESGSASKAAGSPGAPAQRRGPRATEAPPAVPAKAPISHAFSKPKLLKPQRKLTLLKGREESLTYAELELLKPPQEAKGVSSATVYAQILFEENKWCGSHPEEKLPFSQSSHPVLGAPALGQAHRQHTHTPGPAELPAWASGPLLVSFGLDRPS